MNGVGGLLNPFKILFLRSVSGTNGDFLIMPSKSAFRRHSGDDEAQDGRAKETTFVIQEVMLGVGSLHYLIGIWGNKGRT